MSGKLADIDVLARHVADMSLTFPTKLLINLLLTNLVLTNSLLILVGGEVRNQWLDIIGGWLSAQSWEVVAKKEMILHEEADILCRWSRLNDLQGGLPPGGDGDSNLTVVGEGNACSRSTIGLQEGEDGVEVAFHWAAPGIGGYKCGLGPWLPGI